MGEPVRTLLLWCPDWPVLAAEIVDGVPATGPVAVLHANRVIACSEQARAEGVRRGLRRREAQGRCSGLTVVDHDPGRDARAFEPVVAAVEEVAVGVEVIRPGACALAARGPSRYLGGEEAAAERIVEHVALSCAVESQIGVAAGVFAAGLAAREGRIVPPGGTSEFLAWSARRRRTGPIRVRRGAGPAAGRRTGRPTARGPASAGRSDGHRRPGRADRPDRRGGVRGPDAGRATARTARRARIGLHPPGHRGGHRTRPGTAPGLAARRAAHRGGDRRPGPLATGRLALRCPARR